jgi:hypothetical protein
MDNGLLTSGSKMRVLILRGLMTAMLTLAMGSSVVFAGPLEDTIKGDRLAAEQGDAQAQNNLGMMYFEGWGVPKDDKEAIKWFRVAASQGYALAQGNLGLMYAKGRGVPQDYVLSYMWFTVGKTLTPALWPILTAKMTSAQIELAQKLARRCEESHYKQCGEPQDDQDSSSVSATSVPMRMEGGTYVVPVLITTPLLWTLSLIAVQPT